jgi:hypothetical protein
VRFFTVWKSSIIESVVTFIAISLSIQSTKQALKNPSSILFRSLVLTSFIAENARFEVAVETGKVRTRQINLQKKKKYYYLML